MGFFFVEYYLVIFKNEINFYVLNRKYYYKELLNEKLKYIIICLVWYYFCES